MPPSRKRVREPSFYSEEEEVESDAKPSYSGDEEVESDAKPLFSDEGESEIDAKPSYPELDELEYSDDGEDSLEELMAELDRSEKQLQKREHALKRGKGEMRKIAMEEGLEQIPVSQGGLKPDEEAEVPEDFHGDEDSEEAESRRDFDKDLEERLLALSAKEKEMADDIEKFERSLMLDEKHWSLKGEVTAQMRPQDSLLEMNMELPTYAQPRAFDYEDHLAAQQDDGEEAEPAEDKLEREVNLIIRRRCMNHLFDDVEPKDLKDVMPQENKEDKEVLNFKKSTLGLADEYGQEFKEKVLKIPSKVETENDATKIKIADMVSELMTLLDNMTNSHFSTRDRYHKKGFNLQKEDARPLNISRATAKAPEEVAAPEFEVTERADMTKEERKALRRAQKQRRKKLKTT